MQRILFICSENRLRSPTAEAVFNEYDGIEAIGAGTNSDAVTPLSGDLIEWADVIMVMEGVHRNKVAKKYRELLKNKRLVVLDVADNYRYMQDELVQLLKEKVSRLIHLDG
ncbi:MAG: phosphotyrosine protein phosphatase [Gammaproteobacteria bacterium]|nr:phosphotyrosine protein phosphatase [Gammaproteobacteria bacterium]